MASHHWLGGNGVFLALSEIKRSRSRFLLIISIVALITTLILFIVALAEGLGSGNIEGIQKLNANLLVFQDKSKLQLSTSALPWDRLRQVRRVDGVTAVGALGFAGVSIPAEATRDGKALDVALVGVQPGQPGEPPVVAGQQLTGERARVAIVDRKTQLRTGLRPGDTLTIRTVQDAKDEYYELTVVGLADDRQFNLRPAVFVPLRVWDELRPGTREGVGQREVVASVLAVQTDPAVSLAEMSRRLLAVVPDVEVSDLQAAYEATPGYREQQSTLVLQQGFTWFIGLLVIGVFFQIITMQKVAQVGVLKAMGAANGLIIRAALAQMVIVTALGVALGGLGALFLGFGVPATVPLSWPLDRLALTLLTLLVMGPLGGLLSIRILLRVEPLTALGLAK
jgi:putative ABC transport system permease protein